MAKDAFDRPGLNGAIASAIAASRAILAVQSWLRQMTREEQAAVTKRLGERQELCARKLWLDEYAKLLKEDTVDRI